MGDVQLRIHSNFQEVTTDVNTLNESQKKLNESVEDFGERSKQSMLSAQEAAQLLNKGILVLEKRLQGLTAEYVSLARAGKNMTAVEKKRWQEVNDEITNTKNQLSTLKEKQRDLNSQASKGVEMYKKFAGALAGAFTAGAIINFTKEVIASTNATSDALERFKAGVSESFGFLARSLATMDFSGLIKGLKDAYQAGVKYAEVQDLIANRERSDEIRKVVIDAEIMRLKDLARTRWDDVAARKDYVEQIKQLEEEKLSIETRAAKENLDNLLNLAASRSGLNQQEVEEFVRGYRDKYEAVVNLGGQIDRQIAGQVELELQKVKALQASSTLLDDVGLRNDIYEQKVSKLNEAEREALDLYLKTNLLIDDQGGIRDQITDAIVRQEKATLSYNTGLASLQRIENALYSEFFQNAKDADKLSESIFLAELERQNMIQKTILETGEAFEKLVNELSADPIDIDVTPGDAAQKSIETYDIVMQLAKDTSEGQRKEIQKQIDALNEWRDTGVITATQFEEALAKLTEQYQQTYTWAEQHPLWAAIGIQNEQQLQQFQDYAGQIFDVIQDIVDQQVAASERLVDDLNTRIDEQEELVNREFELKKEGLGNNYALEQENLVKMQQARDQAIKDREKQIRIQRTLSTIEASISLITAAANIMKGFSSIPVVGVILGIAAVGAMIAAFVASQAKVQDVTQFAKGGRLRGLRHSEGGIPIPGTGIEVEGDEYVTNRRSTAKYLPLLDAINKDDRAAMKLFFDRKFINKLPGTIAPAFDIDKSARLGEIVRELRRGKADIIYGDGFVIERIGGYTKRINMN